MEVFFFIIIFSLSWENEIVWTKVGWKFFFFIIIFSFSLLGERDSGDKGWWNVLFLLLFFLFLSWENEIVGSWVKVFIIIIFSLS